MELSENKWQGWFTWQEERTEFGKQYDTRASSLRDYAESKGNKPLVEIRRDNVTINSGSSAEKAGKSAGKGNFNQAMEIVFKNEGGYLSDPNAKAQGGASNMGITVSTLNTAHSRGYVKHNDINQLTRNEAKKIYEKMYWQPSKAGELPEPLATIYFDTAVNHGIGKAASILRAALNSAAGENKFSAKDGMSKKVINAVKQHDADYFAKVFLDERQKVYDSVAAKNPSKKKYLKGWINRLNRFRAGLEQAEQPVQKQAKKQKSDREAVKEEADTRLSQITLG